MVGNFLGQRKVNAKDRAIEYCGYTKNKLAEMVSKSGPDPKSRMIWTLTKMRELQIALADSSQKGPEDDRLPSFAQTDLLERIWWLEKWARLAWLTIRMKDLYRHNPDMTHKARKLLANDEFDKTIRPKFSY